MLIADSPPGHLEHLYLPTDARRRRRAAGSIDCGRRGRSVSHRMAYCDHGHHDGRAGAYCRPDGRLLSVTPGSHCAKPRSDCLRP